MHYDRGLDAGRHERPDRVRASHDLGDRKIEAHVRLKEDFLDCDPAQRLPLQVLDAVHVGADGILAVGGDALLHLRGAEAGVLPDHGDDRDVDLGEDVGRHADDRGDAEKKDEASQHIEGVRKPQCKPDYPHCSLMQSDQDPAPAKANDNETRAMAIVALERGFSNSIG